MSSGTPWFLALGLIVTACGKESDPVSPPSDGGPSDDVADSTLSDGDKRLVLAMIRKMATMLPPPVRKPVVRRPMA